MKILGIIPARGGSKRVLHKNKKYLGGKPLVQYVLDAALDSKLLTEVVLSSDDDEILALGHRYSQLICRKRPAKISGDTAQAITYVQDALTFLATDFDLIVIIQPSSPFTSAHDIDSTISLLSEDLSADSAVSVVKLDHAIHPVKLKTMNGKILQPFVEEEGGRMATHELPDLYVRNGSVYVSRVSTIKEGKILGDRCLAYEMPRERSIDINDPIDFEFAEFMIAKNA